MSYYVNKYSLIMNIQGNDFYLKLLLIEMALFFFYFLNSNRELCLVLPKKKKKKISGTRVYKTQALFRTRVQGNQVSRKRVMPFL